MNQPIVSIKNLKKHFISKQSSVKAVDGVDLEVFAGSVFGFLGPNGAGKTTTLRVLTTLMVPDSGEVLVAGLDVVRHPDQVRRKIGYVSQVGGADRSATGEENLVLQGQLYGLSTPDAKARAKELIGLLDLSEFSDRIVRTYSGGQRRRLDVALGLMNRPIVLFLDEPTTGLDPQNRANLWEQIRKLRQEGTTIFLTTHYLEEADALCDTIAIIDNGKIVAMGTPQELKKEVAGDCITISIEDQEDKASGLVEVLKRTDFIREVSADGVYLRLYVDDGANAITEVIHILENQQVILKTITLSAPSLDDVFLRKTGRSLRDLHAEEGGQA
ncbi:MAG: ATP-binding cassette domain-containing protein [Erysipelotrichaceae bacterium]